MAAAAGDNSVWQSCALWANAVSIRKGSRNLGQPKADTQAGRRRRTCNVGAVLVSGGGAEQTRAGDCGMGIGSLWPSSYMCNFPDGMGICLGPFWLNLRDLLMLPQECSKGRAPQVAFPAQVRVQVRDRFRVRVQVRVRVLSAGA